MAELYMQKSCLHRIQTAIVAFDVVVVFLGLAVIPQHADLCRNGWIVSRGSPRFPACTEILPWVEAECCGPADGSSLDPAVQLLRKIFGPMRLAGIFDDGKPKLVGEPQNRIHVGHLAVQMNRYDRRHWSPAAAADRPPRRITSARAQI